VQYRPPEEKMEKSVTVRNDTGVFEGGEISIWYDPMIAKLCTHAATRAEAISAMSDALDSFVIGGIQHNIPFLSAIMENLRWKSGGLSTGFITEEFAGGFKGAELDVEVAGKLARVAVVLDHIENKRKRAISGQMNGRKVPFENMRHVKLGTHWLQKEVTAEIESAAHSCGWLPGGMLVTIDGMKVQVRSILNGYQLSWRGVTADASVYTAREAELARLMPEKKAADTSKALHCPMPGLVVSLAVKEGQEVKAGEPLAIVEAMKMQNILRADRDVTVKKLNAKPGDSLGVDAVIMEFA
jgi:propionyl-CoA carboxylase alpha chain